MVNKNRIKILISDTAPLYPPMWGGPIRIWNLFANLPEEFDITYVGPIFKLGAKYSQTQIKSNLKEISVPITKLYYPFRWFELKFIKGISFELFSYLFMWFDFGFKNVLMNINADILVSSHPWSFPCFRRQRKNQILIYDAHNCEYLLAKMVMRKHWYRNLVCSVIKIIEKNACRKSDIVFSCSEEDAKAFKDLYKIPQDRIYLVPNGTSIKSLMPEEKKDKIKKELNINKALFFVGTYFNPNIEAVKFIIDRLAMELEDCTFLIAGWVKWAFENNSVPKNVRFLGRIDDSELNKIMNVVDIAINPMTSGSGANIKVLDYLSYGLPVVNSPIGSRGLGAIDGEHLIISKLGDFSKNIRKLFDNKELCERLKLNGKKFVEERFNWAKIRDKVVQILRDNIKSEISFYNYSKS